jgi:endonuclease III
MTIQEKKLKVKKIITKLKELFPIAETELKYSNTFEFLVAVTLSAQCTDKMVNRVTAPLFKKYSSLDDYVKADEVEFEQDIKSVTFYRNKAKNILTTARLIKEKYNGKVPQTMEELIILPGVGRKTANVILGNAFNNSVGIAVDTHVRRLSKVLGLTKHDDVVKIEKDLMKIVPREEWTDFTHLMILYGRKYCSARKHDHANCPVTSGVVELVKKA